MTYEFPEWITKADLDIRLFSEYGERAISPVAFYIKETQEDYLTNLAQLIENKYQFKWNKITELLAIEYMPLDPFRQLTEESNQGAKTNAVTESHDNRDVDTRTDDLQQVREKGTTTTNTRTDDLTNEETRNLKTVVDSDTKDGLYGFNSTALVQDTESQNDATNTDTGTINYHNSGTQANVSVNSGQDTYRDTGTQKHDITEQGLKGTNDIYTEEYAKASYRYGNIGNIPTQSLVRSEIELWQWNFIDEIVHDAVDFLTLPIYPSDNM